MGVKGWAPLECFSAGEDSWEKTQQEKTLKTHGPTQNLTTPDSAMKNVGQVGVTLERRIPGTPGMEGS